MKSKCCNAVVSRTTTYLGKTPFGEKYYCTHCKQQCRVNRKDTIK